MAKSRGSAGRATEPVRYPGEWLVSGDIPLPERGVFGDRTYFLAPNGQILDTSKITGRQNPVHVEGAVMMAQRFGWESAGARGDAPLQEAYDRGFIAFRLRRKYNFEVTEMDITTTTGGPSAFQRIRRAVGKFPITDTVVVGWGGSGTYLASYWDGSYADFDEANSFSDLARS
jgi:hypothetical protein